MRKIFPAIFSSNNTKLKPYIILLLLVALAFANSIDNSFVWDDHMTIVNNPNINLPPREMPSIFTTPLLKSAGAAESLQIYYRPILSLYFILNYKIWGMNPVGFHLTNIFLYISTVVILYKIGLLLFDNKENGRLISLVGAAIFAVHPVNSEMAGRAASGEILFGFFIILSLYFFLREKKYLSWSTFALALLSKEASVMLPFALVILSIDRKGIKKGLLAMLPYVVLIGAYLILRAAFVDTILGDKIEKPVLTRLLTMSVATLDYIKLFLIPYPLSPHYPEKWHIALLEPKVILAILVLISISFLAFKLRKDKIMLFLLSFPFIMLAPVIWRVNTFPTGSDLSSIANRFLYVSIMLFSLLISAYAVRLAGEMRRKYILSGWLLVIILFTIITNFSNRIWENDTSLYKRIIRESPDAAFAHYNLGNIYAEQGRIDEAINEYNTAIRLNPDSADVHNNMGLLYYYQGHINDAIKEYNTAIRLNPDFADVHNNMGLLYYYQGRLDDAVNEYNTAIRLNPDFAIARKNLEILYGKKNQIKK